MEDSNVIKAKMYLNAMFGGHSAWVDLGTNGLTGTDVMQGIIRAFQIQNGISDITGTVGPKTTEKMQNLPKITKMDPNDEGSVNVCLIQCALFCKGYNAGGITGIYYNAGVAAVKEFQADAGITVTGIIDWKVWMGLLSLNWFTLSLKGSSITQKIQRQLNGDWSDIIGIGPCDGVVSRQTALSLIGALQGAEKVTTVLITSLNYVNFGEATTQNFPENLKEGQNSDEDIPYNKLVQYGLHFNGFSPYRYDGIYDEITAEKVAAFQNFYGLTGMDLVTEGEVNVVTMKSLLTSKGDTSRKAKACDCSTILNLQQAKDLKQAGYTHVGRYLTGFAGIEHTSKALTLDEIENIKEAGLALFLIYEDGGYTLNYFKETFQGKFDAHLAILAAENLGIPEEAVIYFAVDFDCYEFQMKQYVIPYFEKISQFFNSERNRKRYRVGIYAPRYICTQVSELGYAESSFVADMSTGFSCNLGFPIPPNWAFDQFFEESFLSAPSFDIDKVAYSGREVGITAFDEVIGDTVEENLYEEIEVARKKYIYRVFEPLGFLSKIVNAGVAYNVEIPLRTVTVGNVTIDFSTIISTEARDPSDEDWNINITLDNEENLSTSFLNKLYEIASDNELEDAMSGELIRKPLSDIALSVKVGRITVKRLFVDSKQTIWSISVSTDDLLPDNPAVEVGITVELIIKITISDADAKYFDINILSSTVKTLAVIVIIALACVVIGLEVGVFLEFLISGGILLLA